MAELAPEVEVRGIADSGWFLDYPQFRSKDCIEALSCAPTDGIKRGIKQVYFKIWFVYELTQKRYLKRIRFEFRPMIIGLI